MKEIRYTVSICDRLNFKTGVRVLKERENNVISKEENVGSFSNCRIAIFCKLMHETSNK